MIVTVAKQGRTFQHKHLNFERIPMKGESVRGTGYRLLVSKVTWTINGLASIECNIIPGDWSRDLGDTLAEDGFTEIT